LIVSPSDLKGGEEAEDQIDEGPRETKFGKKRKSRLHTAPVN